MRYIYNYFNVWTWGKQTIAERLAAFINNSAPLDWRRRRRRRLRRLRFLRHSSVPAPGRVDVIHRQRSLRNFSSAATAKDFETSSIWKRRKSDPHHTFFEKKNNK